MASQDERQFLIFLLTGGLAALLNWLSRMGLSLWLPFGPAVVCAHVIGMVVAFVTMRRLAFQVSGAGAGGQFGRFFLVNLVSVAQTWLVAELGLFLLQRSLAISSVSEAIAHGAGIASTVMTSYWLHRRFTFASRKP